MTARLPTAFWLVPSLVVFVAAPTRSQQVGADTLGVTLTYAVGADLSFLKWAEETRGIQFKENGVVRPGLDIFRDHGYDWIRLRLFHSPDRLPNDLEYTIALAQDAKARGFRFLLDYHYADHWADPQQQWAPAAWDTTDIDVLADSVFAYTRETIRAFREAGVMPEMVQIGNEVRNGMMWPLGRLPDHWDNFARLFKAGLDGIDAGRGQEARPLIMLHYDNGADTPGAKAFYDRFHSYGIPYDIIGLSYYPWWHGTLIELRDNVLSLLDHYPDKDIILVEAGYRPHEYRDNPRPPFPEDLPGGPRKAFLEAVNETLLGISDRRVKGIFWWEPASACDRDYFDADCEVRPVITVFDRFKRRE
ncbi:MAG: glycosyl hydrolase 53 family protein [Gemmatimonadales bacterium]|nr:MAG: glycosyl hydrolase 53 family protein [Gemmatimonadales bacterium]